MEGMGREGKLGTGKKEKWRGKERIKWEEVIGSGENRRGKEVEGIERKRKGKEKGKEKSQRGNNIRVKKGTKGLIKKNELERKR